MQCPMTTNAKTLLSGVLALLLAAGTANTQTAKPAESASRGENSKEQKSAAPSASAAQGTPYKYAGIPGVDPQTGIPLYETIQEDWSSLQIGVSKLEPAPPVELQTDEGDGFIRTLVEVQWRPGDPIDLYVIRPKGVSKAPAVLYLYDFKEDTDRFKNNGWAHRATSGGFAAIGFVSALSGSRFRSRPLRQWFVSELQESLGSTVHDVHFILDYLAQRGDIDMDRIGMFGQASGGTIALLAAAAEPRITAVDVLDPWGDWPVWLAKSPVLRDDATHTDFTSPEFEAKVAPLDPVKWLPALKSKQVRIEQVMDNLATPDPCKDAIRNAAPKQAVIVRFNHFSDFAAQANGGKLFEWVKAELKQIHTSDSTQLVTKAQETESQGR